MIVRSWITYRRFFYPIPRSLDPPINPPRSSGGVQRAREGELDVASALLIRFPAHSGTHCICVVGDFTVRLSTDDPKVAHKWLLDTITVDFEGEDVVPRVAAGDIERHLFFGDARQIEIGVENRLLVIDRLDEVTAVGRDNGAAAIQ